MKYLFEDKEADVLSVLYRSAYPSSKSLSFPRNVSCQVKK